MLVKCILALLKRDMRARLHHGWAHSLVDARDNTPLTPALEITWRPWRPWRQLGHITEKLLSEESQMTRVELSRR